MKFDPKQGLLEILFNSCATYIACPLMWKTLKFDEHPDDDFVHQWRNIVILVQLDDVNCSLQRRFHVQHPNQLDCSCVPSMQQRPYIDKPVTFGCMMLDHHMYKAYSTSDQFHSVNNLYRMRQPPDSNMYNPCWTSCLSL